MSDHPTFIHLRSESDRQVRAWLRRQPHPEPIDATICLIPDGENVKIGVSFCSAKDNFCRKKGRAIALNRAKGQGKYASTMTGTTPQALRANLFTLFSNHERFCHPSWLCHALDMEFHSHPSVNAVEPHPDRVDLDRLG